MPIKIYLHRVIAVLFVSMLALSCTPQISMFNEAAYRQAVELKVASLDLIDHASEPLSENIDEAERLKLELLKAWEYAKGRPDNEITARQWEILIDPNRNLLGSFFVRWEERGTLPPALVREFKLIISDTFDTIIALESGKMKPEEVR